MLFTSFLQTKMIVDCTLKYDKDSSDIPYNYSKYAYFAKKEYITSLHGGEGIASNFKIFPAKGLKSMFLSIMRRI